MEANCLTSLRSNIKQPLLTSHRPFLNQVFFCPPPCSLKFHRATSKTSSNNRLNSNNNNSSSSSVEDDINSNLSSGVPPDTVEIRFRRGARKRSRQQQQRQDGIEGSSAKKASAPKDWESMTLAEKALELYIGEKGLLFWLNKFAYASIFIIIGGWILFRFVGPSIGLYQLDTPPLSPSGMFKGGS